MQLLSLAVFAVSLPLVRADGFLKIDHSGVRTVSLDARAEELQVAFGALLGCTSGSKADNGRAIRHTESVRVNLKPIWDSLLKNQYGQVEWPLVRYMAHRHFMQRFSVLVRGLEPTIQVNSSHGGDAEVLSLQAPAMAQRISQKQGVQGFSLDDAATMIAALEKLLFDSDAHLLADIYRRRKYGIHSDLSRADLLKVLSDYMVYWMVGDDHETANVLVSNPDILVESIPHWVEILAFSEGSVAQWESLLWKKPVVGHSHVMFENRFTFDNALEVIGTIARSFASWWEPQCQDTKKTLMAFDRQHTGRVNLGQFYGANKAGEWRFGESEAYLRELGALDETSAWSGKQVIVSNYMQGASNCVVTREHYLLCCRAECEDILGEVEKEIGGPLATVEEVLRVIRGITDGDDNPVQINRALQNQLVSVAATHGGQVPLHGRLFAQWLHYAFPRDCIFPHRAGTSATLTPSQFGDASIVTEEEVNKQVAEMKVANDLASENLSHAVQDSVEMKWMTQWSGEEELLIDYTEKLGGSAGASPLLVLGGAAASVVGLSWALRSKRDVANDVITSKTHFV